jgi:hypothetical protein
MLGIPVLYLHLLVRSIALVHLLQYQVPIFLAEVLALVVLLVVGIAT